MTLTGSLDCDSDSARAHALVIHFFDGARGACWVLILNEGISPLVREVLDRAKLFELILQVFLHYFAFQPTDVDLCSCSHIFDSFSADTSLFLRFK